MRSEARLCPVCGGAGEVYRFDPPGSTNALGGRYEACHGCGGAGWVTVPQPEALGQGRDHALPYPLGRRVKAC